MKIWRFCMNNISGCRDRINASMAKSTSNFEEICRRKHNSVLHQEKKKDRQYYVTLLVAVISGVASCFALLKSEINKGDMQSHKSRTSHRDIYSLRNSRQKEIIEILRWMYNDKGDFYLRRKYEKVQNKIC